ncbi:hypothetical protein [Nonomuraea maritima]|uniref:hypothetical protein n=1 Tax=Nonomuraea maritima TaxID=683260 RepID=UPI003720269E
MTAARDLVQTARDAREAGQRRVARIAADLAAIPGWLRAGDPSRLDDPGHRAAAAHAAVLAAELDAAHRGIAALDAELDALDGTLPSAGFLFLEWSRWLAAVPDAETLLAELDPDPRRLFLGAEPRMTAATARRIVETVAANGGKVGDGDTFVDHAGLSDDDVFDLYHTAQTRLDPLVAGQAVGVLLPLRLETRFSPRASEADPWRLRVRVHPDPVALAAPPPVPTAAEAELVATCWSRCAGDLSTGAGEAAFRALAQAVGGGRAAYLLRTVPVVPAGTGFAAWGEYREQGIRAVDHRAALPEVLQLWGRAGGGLRLLGELRPDHAGIAAQADFDSSLSSLEQGVMPALWWNSYQAAEQVGLATEVILPDGPHLDVLLVTGLGETSSGDVFRAQADRGVLGVVTPMTPTNTVAGAPAADLGRDPATWLATARAHGAGTADGLASWLTGQPVLDGVPSADTSLPAAVPPLVAALWPVLWQRWLKDVAGAPHEVLEMGGWAARLLAPFGPVPALRVGDVPYGVLPAADLTAWAGGPVDPPWEAPLVTVLNTVLPRWAQAAERGGTAAGADATQLLDILARVPTSRAIGSRKLLPLETVVLLRDLVTGERPQDVLLGWRREAEAVLDLAASLGVPHPLRAYQAYGYVRDAPVGKGGVRETLHRYLGMQWEPLAADRREDDHPLLVRLVRQSLLLTQAEVARLENDRWPSWTPPYVLPVHDAGQLTRDAARGDRVTDLPGYALDRLAEQNPPDPRVAAIARQFLDVRQAVQQLAELGDALVEGGPLAPAVAAVLDSASHRIDPWATAPVTRRLRRLAARGMPRRLGAYGWVDDLRPADDPTPPTRAGLLHAPGHGQAVAAAVLRDHAVHDDDPRWQLTARSDRVRLAARLGADVRLGIHPSEAIGREIERRAGDPALVLELRRLFPTRPQHAGRRVCDGFAVLDAPEAGLPAGLGPLDDLREVLDTYGDLLVADAVHDVVSGRGAQAQESMEAAAGLGTPPDLRLLRTQREGASVRTTVLVALPLPAVTDPASPVETADPALAALLRAETGPATDWTWTREGVSVTLAELGLDVPDTVLIPRSRLDELAEEVLGGPASGGGAPAARAAADRLCSLLDAQRGLPEVIGATGEDELRTRLATLRTAAVDVLAGLSAQPPRTGAARRWGLPDDPRDAAEILAARIDRAGDATDDATADAATLGDRIRALLAPVAGLPLACTGTLPATVAAPTLDRDWLEVLAAVRPAMARLEAHQLRRPWPAAAGDPARLWARPLQGEHHVVVYGHGLEQAGPVAIALLDDWAETVPSDQHTTFAAFGFDAPRARAPQAMLLAVPSDERVPLTADELPGIVLATRELARARMAQPDQLGAWSLAVPTSMILTAGSAGTNLVEPR